LYQTLVGVWPVRGLISDNRSEFVGRIQEYMNKALHEAKRNTSWINPNPEYDQAAAEFIARILDPDSAGDFLADLESFQQTVSHFGMFNSLAQTLLKVTAPGVPDTYQGTELWDFSLVDPDNRRPVDYDLRRRLLESLDGPVRAGEFLYHKADGRIKLFVSARAFRYRREHPGLFMGQYAPLEPRGVRAGHLFCFARVGDGAAAVIAVPRLIATLSRAGDRPPVGPEVWGDTFIVLPPELARRPWTNVLTGEKLESPTDGGLPAASVLGSFPVALLAS
jgi:(1->4)-alpha-D-glucan 1-alpha-D-glucosylmutase